MCTEKHRARVLPISNSFTLAFQGVACVKRVESGTGGPLSASQELTHQALIRGYIGLWEGWSMTTITGKPGSEDSTGRLMYHLHNTARLLIPSVVADNASSVRYAHGVLCLWFNQSRFTRYWEEEYRWHSFFLTPDYLSLKETEPQWNMLLRGSKYKKMPLCPLCLQMPYPICGC